MNNNITLCNGVFNELDSIKVFSSLNAIIDTKTNTVTIPHKDGNITVTLADFDAAFADWLSVDCVKVLLYKRLIRLVNNEEGELGNFVDFLSSFSK